MAEDEYRPTPGGSRRRTPEQRAQRRNEAALRLLRWADAECMDLQVAQDVRVVCQDRSRALRLLREAQADQDGSS